MSRFLGLTKADNGKTIIINMDMIVDIEPCDSSFPELTHRADGGKGCMLTYFQHAGAVNQLRIEQNENELQQWLNVAYVGPRHYSTANVANATAKAVGL